jgi:hypothetical protein
MNEEPVPILTERDAVVTDQIARTRDIEIESLRQGLRGIGLGTRHCERHEEPGEEHCAEVDAAPVSGCRVPCAFAPLGHVSPLARPDGPPDHTLGMTLYVQF